MSTKDPTQKISVSSYGGGRLEITGLQPEELATLEAALDRGIHWVRRGTDGRLKSHPHYKPVPDPVEDEEMLPFWRESERKESEPVQMNLFKHGEGPDAYANGNSPSFTIRSLCGYNYTPGRYKECAAFLSACGFKCLRSRRDERSGCFHELWFLYGLWDAKGPLKEAALAIPKSKKNYEKLRVEAALSFLQRNCPHGFGTLDCSVQRLAMRMID